MNTLRYPSTKDFHAAVQMNEMDTPPNSVNRKNVMMSVTGLNSPPPPFVSTGTCEWMLSRK